MPPRWRFLLPPAPFPTLSMLLRFSNWHCKIVLLCQVVHRLTTAKKFVGTTEPSTQLASRWSSCRSGSGCVYVCAFSHVPAEHLPASIGVLLACSSPLPSLSHQIPLTLPLACSYVTLCNIQAVAPRLRRTVRRDGAARFRQAVPPTRHVRRRVAGGSSAAFMMCSLRNKLTARCSCCAAAAPTTLCRSVSTIAATLRLLRLQWTAWLTWRSGLSSR